MHGDFSVRTCPGLMPTARRQIIVPGTAKRTEPAYSMTDSTTRVEQPEKK